MNTVHIHLQAKDDPKNLLSSKEKAQGFPEGLSVIFMEEGTAKKQIGIELIIRGNDIFGRETINAATVTENNFDGVMGAFISARMKWGRMPENQFDLVQYYIRERFNDFVNFITEKHNLQDTESVRNDIEEFLTRK